MLQQLPSKDDARSLIDKLLRDHNCSTRTSKRQTVQWSSDADASTVPVSKKKFESNLTVLLETESGAEIPKTELDWYLVEPTLPQRLTI